MGRKAEDGTPLVAQLSKILTGAERAASTVEREMRKINHRADLGVQWTAIARLLRLRHLKRIDPGDPY